MTKAPEFDASQVMSSYYDAKLKPAQLDNLEGATRNAAASTAADIALKTAQAGAVSQDTHQKGVLFTYSKEAAEKANHLLDADIALRRNQGYKAVDERQKIVEEIKEIKQRMSQEKDKHPANLQILKGNAQFQKFKAHLQSMGLTESDGVLWRLFGAGLYNISKANEKQDKRKSSNSPKVKVGRGSYTHSDIFGP